MLKHLRMLNFSKSGKLVNRRYSWNLRR